VAALVVGIGCLTVVAWANAGSRNIALATAALFASVVLLIVQIPFELRSKHETALFGAEYTIDRLKPQIRQWSYPKTSGWRLTAEVAASDALAKSDPNAFKGDGQRLCFAQRRFGSNFRARPGVRTSKASPHVGQVDRHTESVVSLLSRRV
jgi:hypothetical protein